MEDATSFYVYRRQETQHIAGVRVIIFEGILALYDKAVNSIMDIKIFVDTDADVRLSRRRNLSTHIYAYIYIYIYTHPHAFTHIFYH